MIKNIFFDFDGVIADSVGVKTAAFKKIYGKFGSDVEMKVCEHHLANGGISRFEKFKYYHKNFLGIDLDDKGLQELVNEFSEEVMKEVIRSPQVDGAHEFLNKNKENFTMFIITGTPTKESREICKQRGIIKCFKGIYGSPRTKNYWCKYLLAKYKLDKVETIFIGDALTDYNAAIENDLKFFLRESKENEDIFKEISQIYRFHDFFQLNKILTLL